MTPAGGGQGGWLIVGGIALMLAGIVAALALWRHTGRTDRSGGGDEPSTRCSSDGCRCRHAGPRP